MSVCDDHLIEEVDGLIFVSSWVIRFFDERFFSDDFSFFVFDFEWLETEGLF